MQLTAAELETLRAMAEGKKIAEHASERYLSVQGVKCRLVMIRKKLGAKNTTHAVAIAMQKGLI